MDQYTPILLRTKAILIRPSHFKKMQVTLGLSLKFLAQLFTLYLSTNVEV